ncbi:MAG: hypothetical protein JST86_20635 [Bacteroidetes bacterium]|nr:hypothetical protein [Bacteroidota bacterium]
MTEETMPQEPGELVVKPEEVPGKTSLSRTLGSFALFIAVYYMVFHNWMTTILLAAVILIHELGHFIAMKRYGYSAVNMTFIPFVGAYVSGKAVDLSRTKKLIVLMAGPLPGIIIGIILFFVYQYTGEFNYLKAAGIFGALNVINLLPVYPLDGGQYFQVLFFYGSKIVQIIFLCLSAAVMLYLFVHQNYAWINLVIALFALLRITSIRNIYKTQKALDEAGIDYACTYDDLTDDEYWAIRNIVISQSALLSRKYSTYTQEANEADLIPFIERVLVSPYNSTLTAKQKLVFTLVWILTITVPVVLWMQYKGWL